MHRGSWRLARRGARVDLASTISRRDERLALDLVEADRRRPGTRRGAAARAGRGSARARARLLEAREHVAEVRRAAG